MTFFSGDPSVAALKNNVYVAWENGSENDDEIFFVISSDNGQTFSDIQNISDSDKDSDDPSVAVFKNNVYIAFENGDSDTDRIFFTYSDDNGQTFKDIKDISGTALDSADPSAAVFKNNVYVTWELDGPNDADEEVLFTASTDNGDTFEDVINLSNSGPDIDSDDPRAAAFGYDVYILFEEGKDDESENEVLIRGSNDKGITFGEKIDVSNTDISLESEDPAIALVP